VEDGGVGPKISILHGGGGEGWFNVGGLGVVEG